MLSTRRFSPWPLSSVESRDRRHARERRPRVRNQALNHRTSSLITESDRARLFASLARPLVMEPRRAAPLQIVLREMRAR